MPHSGPSKANDEPDEKGGFLPVGFRAREHTEVRHSLDGRLGGQTRTFGGLYDIFQMTFSSWKERVCAAGAAHVRMTGKSWVWKTQALCATVRLK
jgi:hypothetical protein